jgi:hypothetical protein
MIDAKAVVPAAGLAVAPVLPATGLPGLAATGLAGLPVVPATTGLTDPRDVFAATYLEKRVGLPSEEAAKIVTEHGYWCLYEAQRHRGGGAREALEDLIPGYSDEVYGKLGEHLDGLRAKRASARKNEKIMALVDACSAVSGLFCISRRAWSFIEEKLLDTGVTIELLLALLASEKDVMCVLGPDELEELGFVLGPRVNVAGMLEHVASIHSAESVEPIGAVEAVGLVEAVVSKERSEDGAEGSEGPRGSDGPEGSEGSEGQAVREEPHEEPHEETREEPVPGTPPPVVVQAVMPGKPKDREGREDREDRGRGGAKKRRLFPKDDDSV